ncbi:MAG: hypothetical protein RLZ00_462 [Pseudomonadota bacterium]|jgi:uncharacterized flavoprotein (TIGR03862 family)
MSSPSIAIIGAGPSGLMAAEMLSAAGVRVHVYDAMPSVGRKFLLAGLGGLNLTHAEPFEQFVTRYGERKAACAAWLKDFDAQAIRDWVKGLGLDTFVGSSQRVFPTDMKAAPLLRAWLYRLRHPAHGKPVTFHMRHRWNGDLSYAANNYTLTFDTPQGPCTTQAQAVLLALGGGSWAKLGSDGAWVPWLNHLGLDVAPLQPSNCGFDVQGGWTDHLREKFAGTPIKGAVMSFEGFARKGEFVLTATGIEGSLVYAASALLRDAMTRDGRATLYIDLKPELSAERVWADVSHPRGSRSWSNHLKSRLNLSPVHLALLHEALSKEAMTDPARIASAIKALPLTLHATRPIDEAISTAGGVKLEALTPELMANTLPGLFVAGEMLDWEAPTGGYLLSACLASGRLAGLGAAKYLLGKAQLRAL